MQREQTPKHELEDVKEAIKILWNAGYTFEMIYTVTDIHIPQIKEILGLEVD